MKREKFASLKQKIICIPIIMMTLISFIIPNYAHAGVGEDIFEGLQEVILFVTDSGIVALEKLFVPESANKTKSEIIVKGTAKEAYEAWYDLREENGDNAWWDDWTHGAVNIPGIGDVGFALKNFLWRLPGGHKTFYGEVEFSKIKYSPQLIFTNKVPALDANFFKKDSDYSNKEKEYSIAYQLKNIIATWYVALRNIALVIMLLVLVFIGIKITISSVSSEKAKYKQLLIDWIVAICLLIFLHYIMVFAVNIVQLFIEMFSESATKQDFINIERMAAALPMTDENTMTDKFFHTIVYIALIIYTLIFTWQYIKRIIKLAFMTLFAPIMAASYPIDKMMDGQAQGFNKWLKDYIYELFVQPLHLLIYLVLISSVSALAQTNQLYALVALFSIIYIEKMLRDYLGFERGHVKPPNPGGLLAAATLGRTAMNALLPSNVKNKSGKDSGGDSLGSSSNEKPVNTSRGDNPYSLLAGGNGEDETKAEEGKLPRNKPKEDELNEKNKKGFGLEPISDKKEDWDSLRRTMNGGNGLAPISSNKSDFDALRAAYNMPNKRNIKKPNNLRKNIGAARSKIGNNKFAKGAKAVGRKYGGNFVRKLAGGKTGIRGVGNALAGTMKIGAGLAGAATLGTYGLVMGGVMGDPSKALQLGLGGLATGYAVGGKAASLGTGLIGKGDAVVAGVGNTFMSGADPVAYDKKLQEQEQRRIVREIKNNDAAMRMFKVKNENMSDKDIDAGINECVSQGIDSPEDIQTVFDLRQKAGIDRTTAMGAVKIAKNTSASELRNEGKTEDLRKSIERNLKGSDAERQSYDAIDILRKIHKVDSMDSSRSSYAEAMAAKQKKAQETMAAERRKKAKEAYEKKKSEHITARNENKNGSGGSGRRGPRTK